MGDCKEVNVRQLMHSAGQPHQENPEDLTKICNLISNAIYFSLTKSMQIHDFY